MKSKHADFAARLKKLLDEQGFEAGPGALQKLLARKGGSPVTSQAISGWLSGRYMPKFDNLVALNAILGDELLRSDAGKGRGVRDRKAVWPEHVPGPDRLLFEDFLKLTKSQQEAVRAVIAAFVESRA